MKIVEAIEVQPHLSDISLAYIIFFAQNRKISCLGFCVKCELTQWLKPAEK